MKHTEKTQIINISGLIDEEKCYQKVRELRWTQGMHCAWCDSNNVVKNGCEKERPGNQNYHCKDCKRYFNDLTNTIFSGHHQPLSVWIFSFISWDSMYQMHKFQKSLTYALVMFRK